MTTRKPSVSEAANRSPEDADAFMQSVLRELVHGHTLSRERARTAFSTIMSGQALEPQIGALLALVQQRGPTADELTGAATVMREFVTRVPIGDQLRTQLIDTCGTGGAPKTFNVSTAAAIVAAGAGAKVAKHGNRSRTGRGSAEVLMKLGVNVNASPDHQAKCVEDAGVCFSFAIHHHPAIRHAMPARRALGFPTMYNLLGPLTNPAGAQRQLLGVYRLEFAELLAETLQGLGSVHAMVVHGLDGLDEMTVTTRTHVAELRDGTMRSYEFDPTEVGIERNATTIEDLQVETLDDAAACVRRILENEAGPKRDMTIVNAGAALCVADLAADLTEGVKLADAAISSGKAKQALEALVETSNASS